MIANREYTEYPGEVVEKLPVGLLRFEHFGPGEWMTKKGEPAKIARRRYLLGDEEVDAVSSIVDTLSKPGLYPWYEDHGARGAVQAERMGELDGVPLEEIVKRVRLLGLGATAKKDEGADRGHAIHAAFQALATTGEVPKLADFPVAWHPWVKGCAEAWLKLDPESIKAEFMVCHPEMGYAGRPDLLCRSNGQSVLLDYKTGKGKIYEQAHYQTRGYVEAFEPCEIDPPDRILIVGISDEGAVQLVDCEADSEDWRSLVRVYRSRKRVNAAIAVANKRAKTQASLFAEAA